MKRRYWFLAAFVLCFIGGVALTHVSTQISPKEEVFLREKFNEQYQFFESSERKYSDEIEFLYRVQQAVLSRVNGNEGVPHGESREPIPLWERRRGLCYDRSRMIEKVVALAGFKVVHVAVYDASEIKFPRNLLTPGISSHALSKVKTQKGWVLVDSNKPFISVDQNLNPVPFSKIQSFFKVNWHHDYVKSYESVFTDRHTLVFGLYSRHGRFFPPYTPFPDLNWPQLIYNFI